jgi:alpha-galactosidase
MKKNVAMIVFVFWSIVRGYSAPDPNRPIMGFDTYYSGWNGTADLSKPGRTNVYCGPSEEFVLIMATNYLKHGLHAVGYDWMCISDGWQGGRDEKGDIYADPIRFPSGMAGTIEKLHQLGFKVRLYTEVGRYRTCCGKVKSSGLAGLRDAQTFARWKVDGVTVDTCSDKSPDRVKQAAHETFIRFLGSNSVPILYDVHVSPTQYQYTNGPAEWMGEANSWQFTTEWGTLSDPWLDAVSHIDMAALTTQWMRPGHTPNLLILSGDFTAYRGNFGRLLFTFWSMFQSPLVVADDYIVYPGWDGAKYQTNRYCIAIDRDPLFVPPTRTFTNGANSEVWIKPLASGEMAMAFLNRANQPETIDVNMQILGVSPGVTYTLTDAWNYTNFQASATNRVFDSPPTSAQLWILHPPKRTVPR